MTLKRPGDIGLLPDLIGIPLIIQDKSFVPQNILDPGSQLAMGRSRRLWYPHEYEPTTMGGQARIQLQRESQRRSDYGPCDEAHFRAHRCYTLPIPLLW